MLDRLVDAVRRAGRLISQHFPRQSGDTLTLAIRSDRPVTSPAVRDRVISALVPFGRAPHVTAVGSPYQVPGRISADGHIAFATVQFGVKRARSRPARRRR
jgi:putative drug exporter of the RND superfamily